MPTVADTNTMRERIRELGQSLETKNAVMRECAGAFRVEPDGVIVEQDLADKYRSAKTAALEIKGLIEDLESGLALIEFGGGQRGGGVAGADRAAEHEQRHQAGYLERKTVAETITASDGFEAIRRQGSQFEGKAVFSIPGRNIGRRGGEVLDSLETKDIFTAKGGTFTVPAFGSTQNDGLVIPAYRTVRIRDLFPVAATTANNIEYVRRTGYVNSARVVAERTAADGTAATGGPTDVFGLKPPSDLTFTTEQAPVRTIAHTIDASKTILDDEPRLQDTINGEMLYGLRLVEDAEILNGDGTGAHLLGILNVPGLQVYHLSDHVTGGGIADTSVDALRRAMTLVYLAYYEPTAVVMHPFDWEGVELTKNLQGSYLVIQNVAVGAQKTVWSCRVVATPAMPQGQFLAGAFGLGAKLYDREQANVAISTETRDVWDRNAVAIRAEERCALEVPRPESFVHGYFS